MKKNIFSALLGGIKEAIRKWIVGLKRNPKTIALVVMAAAFLIYSLNLTHVSFTTSVCQGIGLGLCEFIIMLLSVLAMVCMLNAFPRRQKVNIPMLVLVFVMLGIIVYCDFHYINGVISKINDPVAPVVVSATDRVTSHIPYALSMFRTHVAVVIASIACVALTPVFGKLLQKINTAVVLDDNGDMGEIEIASE